MKLTGNTILLTGGTSGIGYALLEEFYTLGNNLIVAGSSPQRLKKLQEKFPLIETINCDLVDEKDVQQLIDTCLTNHTRINIVINNAGVQYNYIFGEHKNDYAKIRNEITINLVSPLQICFGLIPLLIKHPESAIVNISSALIYSPKKSAPVYCGTKAAIHNTTKALRYQLEHTPVKVFEIIPPLVDTPMTTQRGKGKISPAQLAKQFVRNFSKNKYEGNIGRAKLLKNVQRFLPSIADRIMKDG
jgi:short-subunit dehydrogenase involved in D-alanine esterification of teichoic acids